MSLRPLVALGSWPVICSFFLSATHAAELSLDQAVAQALAGNRGFAASYFEVEKAQGRALQAGLPRNPEVEVGGRSDLLFKNEGERAVTLGVSQALPRKGRLRLAREAATLSIGERRALVRDAERSSIARNTLLALFDKTGSENAGKIWPVSIGMDSQPAGNFHLAGRDAHLVRSVERHSPRVSARREWLPGEGKQTGRNLGDG